MRCTWLIVLLCSLSSVLCSLVVGQPKPAFPEATPAAAAVKTWAVPDGFELQLIASEPHVASPVALTWDEAGRLYVIEMNDYPDGKNGGTIKLLEDRDGDGTIDCSTVFADKIPFPTGAFPWRGGLLVTAAPDILYLKDTNGDGKADQRRVLFTGFGEGNQQHRVNGLMWGVDNWIYGGNGDSGGKITAPEKPNQPGIELGRRDFRIRPDELLMEPVSGYTQFGHTFDDWGRRYTCDNRTHIRQVLLPEHALQRNPHLAVPFTQEPIADYGGSGARLYPISPTTERFNDYDHVGHFTAACGLHIYRGHLFGDKFYGNAFVCDAVGNLVHRMLLVPHGPGVIAKRAEEKKEFLASRDPWSRPCFLATGPDGALWIVDMYRAIIEHPKWIPSEAQKRYDLRAGANMGRIYRLVPKGTPKYQPPNLAKATSKELVALLDHKNVWHRDTAQRLLYERQDKTVVGELEEALERAKDAQTRIRAMWTLEGMVALREQQLATTLQQTDPLVLVHALRLGESYIARSKAMAHVWFVLRNHIDKFDPLVRFHYVIAGSSLVDQGTDSILATIAAWDADHHWSRWAILTVYPKRLDIFSSLVRSSPAFMEQPSASKLRFLREFGAMVGSRGKPDEVEQFLKAFVDDKLDERWQFAAVGGVAEGVMRTKPLAVLLGTAKEWQAVRPYLQKVLGLAERRADDEKLAIPARVEAIGLLNLAEFDVAKPALVRFLGPKQPPELQLAAAQALGRRQEKEVASLLLAGWKSYSPSVRREVLDAIMRQRNRFPALLDAIEQGVVGAGELDALRQRQLLRPLTGTELERAEKLLAGSINADRQKVIKQHIDVLAMKADLSRGRTVFQKHCANCHQFNDLGVAVGPDLNDVRGRPALSLLEDLLDPNRAVAPAFGQYIVDTRGGQTITGLLAAEAGNSITLMRAEGATDVIFRSDIREIVATGRSLMPDGLENTLSRQELADLIGYLKGEKPK
jgi:putative membrane-bound dehydrogenase-like protein